MKLYFAYGSNLNHHRMSIRCKDSKYIKSAFLEGYKLSFCGVSKDYGVANVVKKKIQKFLVEFGKYLKVMKRKYSFKPPQRQYLNIINQGYEDCNLDREYLKKRLSHCNIEL